MMWVDLGKNIYRNRRNEERKEAMGRRRLRRTTQGTHQSKALSESHKDWKSDPRNGGWVSAHVHAHRCMHKCGGR